MDLDFMTAPVVDEFGNAEYDNTIGEYIMNSSSMLMTMQVTMPKATKRVEIRRTTMTTGR